MLEHRHVQQCDTHAALEINFGCADDAETIMAFAFGGHPTARTGPQIRAVEEHPQEINVGDLWSTSIRVQHASAHPSTRALVAIAFAFQFRAVIDREQPPSISIYFSLFSSVRGILFFILLQNIALTSLSYP